MVKSVIGAVVVAVAFGAVNLQAAFLSPVSATSGGEISDVLAAGNLIKDATGVDYVQTSAADMWVGDTGASSDTPLVVLTFDLGANYNLSHLYVWSFNYPGEYFVQQRSVNEFNLLVSADGTSYTSLGAINLVYVGDPADQVVQIFALTDADNVRYVQFDIKSNWINGGRAISSYTPGGLGDVAVEGAAVPEPASAAIMLMGAAGLLASRKK